VLADGRTVLLGTFTCGFYRVSDIDAPSARWSSCARSGRELRGAGAVGHLVVQTVPDEHALVTLDVSDPSLPREVSRATFDSTFRPHWLALDEGGSRSS